ncbi:hypothetical protein AAMO2058_000706900 [Amorphochlora amoebiformis]
MTARAARLTLATLALTTRVEGTPHVVGKTGRCSFWIGRSQGNEWRSAKHSLRLRRIRQHLLGGFASRGVSETACEDTSGMGETLMIVKKACDALAPLVRSVYYSQSSETSQTKADKSMFTIADGMVQELLLNHLFKRVKFKDIVAEEDIDCNIRDTPFKVGDLTIPTDSKITKEVVKAKEILDRYSTELESLSKSRDDLLKSLTLFLDPIDGTKEFVQKRGEACTICVGFARDGIADAGIVYRPIPDLRTWAAGCKRVGYFAGELNPTENSQDKSGPLFVTPSSVSPFIQKVIDEMKGTRLAVGGCGHKSLMLLEKPNSWYILDRGLSRWDTCAAQAVLEARGGGLCKLTGICDPKAPSEAKLDCYTYRKASTNPDMNDLAYLTPYNIRKEEKAQFAKSGVKERAVRSVDELDPNANICGCLAYSQIPKEKMQALIMAIKRASASTLPFYT